MVYPGVVFYTPRSLGSPISHSAGPVQRPKLNLKPRSVPKDSDQSSALSDRAVSIFGGAKPVDTAAKEREVEERLKKEQERLQRQLEEEKAKGPERRPRER